MIQFLKFACVGALNTAIDFAVLNALLASIGSAGNPWAYGACKAVSFSCALANSYIWNKTWVFSAPAAAGVASQRSARDRRFERGSFLAVSIFGLLVNVAISSFVFALIPILFGGASSPASETLLANAGALAGTFAVLLLNFFGYKHFVFRTHAAAPPMNP